MPLPRILGLLKDNSFCSSGFVIQVVFPMPLGDLWDVASPHHLLETDFLLLEESCVLSFSFLHSVRSLLKVSLLKCSGVVAA